MAKIALVANASWNVWNFRLPVLRALERQGHETTVIAPRDDYTERIPFPVETFTVRSRSMNPLTELQTAWSLASAMRRVGPDLALLFTVKPNIYGNLAAFTQGVATVSSISGLGYGFSGEGLLRKVVEKLYAGFLKVPSKVFFHNDEDLELFVARGLVSRTKAERVAGSGVDLTYFNPVYRDSWREKRGDESDVFHFLLPARMLRSKGVLEFLDAAERLSKERGSRVRFQLLGDSTEGGPESILPGHILTESANENLELMEKTDDIREHFCRADCVVLPSYREGLSRTLLEAASMGLPIVTTDVPGCRDVVNHGGNGFLCNAQDADDLYLKMKMVLDLSAVERARMGRVGREKVEREFDQELVAARYVSAITDVLRER